MRLDTTIGLKGKIVRGTQKNKTRVTVLVTANADGSEKRQAMIINKSKTPVCFRTAKINPKNLPMEYRCNKKAWILSGLWYEYLHKLNTDMKSQNGKIALITDNAPTYPPPNQTPEDYSCHGTLRAF